MSDFLTKKILVTGGAGYVGSVLVKKLLRQGYRVNVLDLFLYEPDPFKLYESDQFRIFKGDIRDISLLRAALDGVSIVIHLACISNDPSFDLDPSLGRSINLDAFSPLVETCKLMGVKRFINASSSSVYGVSDEPKVTELSPCKPLTDYSRFKLDCEHILKDFQSDTFTTCSVRSATVCGYSPRQRLDVIVNILSNHAFHNRKIIVDGGEQLRPNVHIQDLTNFYIKLCTLPKDLIAGEVFNFGHKNLSVNEIALAVKLVMENGGDPVEIERSEVKDARSYRISSDKAWDRLCFRAQRSVAYGAYDLKIALMMNLLPQSMTDKKYFNVKALKESNLQ